MIDTHTHLYDEAFADGGMEAVDAAVAAGVEMMILPGIDVLSLPRLLTLHKARPQHTRIALGLHPTETHSDWETQLRTIFVNAGDEKPVAIGEIGMDLYWDASEQTCQEACFERQLKMACDMSLPAIVHCRSALEPTLRVIDALGEEKPRLVFHSFTGSSADAAVIMDHLPDAMFGINGVATFKNCASLREAIAFIGIERILLETDSPYLAPVPFRGKRNESAYLPKVLETVALAVGMDMNKADKLTTRNAIDFFRL